MQVIAHKVKLGWTGIIVDDAMPTGLWTPLLPCKGISVRGCV
jgi:hypothetical protein